MKHNLLKSVILSVILLMGVSNAWAYNEYNKRYLYFDGSAFTAFFSDDCKPYISPKWDYNGNDGNNNGGNKQMTQINTSNYYYLDLSNSSSSYASFRGFYIGRGANFYNGAQMGYTDGSTDNCIKATGWGTYSWSKYAPPMKSASIENTSTVYGGDGTQGNPYQIIKGTNISVSATATSTIPNDPQTKYYKFYKKENSGTRSAIGNESTTTTSSFTASSTAGTKYEVDVEARNEYYSTYGTKATSSKLYFVTIEPIYAILGSFNDWTHSANTWDLSDQGSYNWKATFHLNQGDHTFKVVHNSSYYGRNSTTITRSSATASNLSTSGANINLTADYAGNYTFTFNSSTKNLTVTYPTIYKVTYSQTPAAAANAPTTSPSVQSGNSVVSGTSLIFTAQTAKTGYTWKGWYDNNAGTGNALSSNLSYTRSITANTTIYAVYTANTYTVAFNANGGIGTMSNQNFTYGTSQNLTANTFTRTGYTFAGWNTKADGTGTSYTDKQSVNNLTSTNGATVTLYAKWTANQYTIIYKDQGNVTFTGTHAAGAPTKHTYGTATTLKTASKTGYTFDGWFTSQDCSGSAVTTLGATAYTSAITLYAKWTSLPENTVYLKPEEWANDGARFAVYAFHNNASNGEWYDMTPIGCGDYYTCNIPAKHTQFSFCRMDPKKGNDWSNKWNQSNDFSIATYKNQVFTHTTWGQDGGKCTGTWDTYNPTITLTLKSSSNGKYHIIHKGSRYESSLTEDVNIDLPLNAEIIISDVADARPGYTFKKRYIKIGTNAKEEAATNTPYQLCGSTSITADFVTIIPHTVYFKPNANWTGSSARFAVYVYDEVGKEQWYDMTSATGGYYTCTIEAGWSKLIFVRMNPAHNTNKFADGYSWNQTYSHAIPVNRFNTYVLYDDKWGADDNEGYWTHTPTFTNSYRLRYAEQVIEEADGWKTVINETSDSHRPDDVLPQQENRRDTISLFINTAGVNPEVILEQYNGTTWEVKERRMVNGPLETNNAGLAMLPGRRNAPGELTYDNGIDAITESGVWNFIIVQDGSGNATIKVDETHLYTGDYYIRTNNTAGGWNTYTHLDNHMKLSTNAESGYTHYYCKWVDISTSNNAKNVKYIVANDYSINVSKELAKDIYTANDGDLVENANVRWTWNDKTGAVARAYIQGAFDPSTDDRLNNIVLDYTTDGTTDPADETLDDSGDWIYTKDVTVRSGATLVDLTATYPSKDQGVVTSGLQTFIEGPITLLEGMSEQEYTVRVTYDFKNNKATTFLIPGASEIATAVDVMIERVDQGVTAAVQAPISGITKDETTQSFRVCAVMSFTKEHLNNKSLHNDLRQFYWISFPFDVNLEDVYGFGVYGKHWILEEYNGARRAKDGLWLDSPSFWEFILDPKDKKIEANKGYLLCLDLDLLGNNSDVFANTNKVSLYFPSTKTVTGINDEYTITEVTVSTHIRTEKRANRHIYDSNWNLIGVPSYANKDQSSTPTNLQYFYDYKYNESTKKMEYVAKSSTNGQFNSMYAYFVQWGGTLNWTTLTGTDNTPREELQARKNANYEEKKHDLRLELLQNSTKADQTFISLQEGDVTTAFDLNQDMTKIINAGANIYTLAGTEMIQLAGNSLPIANTVIPVGVQIATAGEYTFAMPDGTDGIVVELIDYETNIRTNLMLDEYTVDLAAGTNEARFALHVKPNKVTTSLEDGEITTTNGKVRKFLIDGVLYLQKDGNIYDAQGKLIR